MLNAHAHAHGPEAPAPLPLLAACDLQDDLMTATHDLDRLQTLLAHACDQLMLGFQGATHRLRESFGPGAAVAEVAANAASAAGFAADTNRAGNHPPVAVDAVLQHLADAVTALQFQDMASQLVAHTQQRLRSCADRLAHASMGDDDGTALVEDAPLRPNPVTQDEMDAGSVELF